MSLRDGFASLEHGIYRPLDPEWAFALHERRQRFARQVLHDDERSAVGSHVDVENARHVWASDLACRTRFSQKTLGVATLTDGTRQQELDRDGFAELQVLCRDHRTHSADAEHALDAILVVQGGAEPDEALELG